MGGFVRIAKDMSSGSPWNEDKAMMSRWGLEGMRSFEQTRVANKELARETVTDTERMAAPAAEVVSKPDLTDEKFTLSPA
jgi:Asp-tRNA(Asn)/Glu-tRNA(Gln) amidotransferase B subunit